MMTEEILTERETAETDTKETPKKKWIKSTPSSTKPPSSATVGKAPNGINIDEVKESEDARGNPAQAPEPSQDEKP